MTKILRLAVATLTDVGRRRERNQDNVTHYVPDDPEQLAQRGALFVVCDGMGGHAAGEIAAEIAVQTIREQYFQESDEDVISALARAIQTANSAIYDHAREHQAHSGMGTTCVLVVLAGGRAYFANIGDSRAYLLRDGEFRQVTRDHSWVAEQVRAGILTEEQARTHAHRNVITRSLGTQPEITADLFIETMREGDRVLLCSDGLHGYVAEEDIQQVVAEQTPEEGVHRLIDMANANGGPDNITAVLVELLEVPPVLEELRLPAAVGVAREAMDASLITTLPIPRVTAPGRRTSDLAALDPAASGAISAKISSLDGTAGGSGGAARRHHRARWPVVVLRVLAVAALIIFAVGLWDFTAGPVAAQRAATTQLQRDIASAQAAARAASTQDPATALSQLAAAQQRLQNDLATLPANSQTRAQAQQTLQQQVAPAVRLALTTYNQQNMIVSLPASAVTTYTMNCAASLASGPAALAAVGLPNPTGTATAAPVALYALSGNGAIYALALSGTTATCGTTPIVAQGVKALASDGPRLYALVQNANKQWVVLDIDAQGKSAPVAALPADAMHMPLTLATHNNDVYVAYEGAQPDSGGIWHFVAAAPQDRLAQVIAMPMGISALSVTVSGIPFALLRDGSLASVDTAGHVAKPSVSVATPVPGVDPATYTVATPVPTLPPTATPAPASPTPVPTAGQAAGALAGTPATGAPTVPATGATPGATAAPTQTPTTTTAPGTLTGSNTQFGGSSSLSAERGAAGTLVVADGSLPRVVRFAVVGATLSVQREYVYGAPLLPLQSVTTSPDGTRLYAWSGAQLVAITLPT